MGVNDLFNEGRWVFAKRTHDGHMTKNPVVFTRWAPGEPNNAAEEDCGEMYSNGNWNDCRCQARLYIICETM